MNITIYTKTNCPNCKTAKDLLVSKGLLYKEVDIEVGHRFANFVANYPDAKQMPQIFIGDQRVGGLAGLQAALKQIEQKNEQQTQ
jgi:glutaredoxin 3